jgi:hypothetical protein
LNRCVRLGRSILVAVLALGGASALAACSDETSRTREPTPSVTTSASPAATSTAAIRSASAPDPATVAWLDDFCAARKPASEVMSGAAYPQVPDITTEADRSTAIAFLTKARDAFKRSSSILADVGASPVDGGDEVVTAARRDIDKLRRSMDRYLSNVKRFPASEIGAPFRLALIDLVTASPFKRIYDLSDRDPAVAEAYKVAPECA